MPHGVLCILSKVPVFPADHLFYQQDSNLPIPKAFPGIPLGKRSCSGVYWQSPAFAPCPFYSPGRSQGSWEVKVASSSKKDGNLDLGALESLTEIRNSTLVASGSCRPEKHPPSPYPLLPKFQLRLQSDGVTYPSSYLVQG